MHGLRGGGGGKVREKWSIKQEKRRDKEKKKRCMVRGILAPIT